MPSVSSPWQPAPGRGASQPARTRTIAPLALAAALGLGACTQDVDPPWQLDHARVIAVRATPPRLASGDVARLDALVGREGAAPLETVPDTAEVLSPTSLAAALSGTAGTWTVTAPGAAQLAAARAELGLAADAPVPLQLRVTFSDSGLAARKVVWLGARADNVVIPRALVDGQDAMAQDALTVGAEVDVPLAVDFDARHNVNWLTSCGTMHDFDLARAYLRVEAADPQAGAMALVVRDDQGGVAWRVWTIAAR